jgi:hypothetical protein
MGSREERDLCHPPLSGGLAGIDPVLGLRKQFRRLQGHCYVGASSSRKVGGSYLEVCGQHGLHAVDERGAGTMASLRIQLPVGKPATLVSSTAFTNL